MKVAVVVGTRPEVIKMAPVVRELERTNTDFFIVHTGQHYSYRLDAVFFEQLRLPPAKYNLEVGSGSHAEQTARTLIGVENALQGERPDIVLVEGDTNSVLGGALAAAKLRIEVGHVEAGLRSYDSRMPEETNRILTDHCSDYLFAPTDHSKTILLGEGVPEAKVFVTGNTIVDAVYQHLEKARESGNVLSALDLKPKGYFLVTIHREESIENKAMFSSLLKGLDEVAREFALPVIYPVHPHSWRRMIDFDLKPETITLVEPVDFLSFLQLESNAKLILTDSGGVQEEACILGVPCITLRDSTERPETIGVGANMLVGACPDGIVGCSEMMLARQGKWANPFGDGKAANRIVEIVRGAKYG